MFGQLPPFSTIVKFLCLKTRMWITFCLSGPPKFNIDTFHFLVSDYGSINFIKAGLPSTNFSMVCSFSIYIYFNCSSSNSEQSLSKTHQRASKRGSAEIVSSLLSHRSPSFWANNSSQTGLGSTRIIIFDKAKVKVEPSVQKSIWCLGVWWRLGVGLKLSPSNSLHILNEDLTRFLQSPLFFVEFSSHIQHS